MTVKPRDPLAAWVTLLATLAPVVAIVPSSRIVYDIMDITSGSTHNWIIVSPGMLEINNGFWDGYVQLTFLGMQGHVLQQLQNEVIYGLCDPILGFRTHRIASGSQAGAILSTAGIGNLRRGWLQIEGDYGLTMRSINVETKMSVEAMSWS